MDTAFRDLVDRECRQRGLEFEVSEAWYMPVTRFAPQCVEAVRNATAMLGYSNMEMVSGAGHDSLYIATVAPTSMIFVPCENGISHNEIENAKPVDLEAGCNVLLTRRSRSRLQRAAARHARHRCARGCRLKARRLTQPRQRHGDSFPIFTHSSFQ